MTEQRQGYSFKGKPGPRSRDDDNPALNKIQIVTPIEDNRRIRDLVGKGNLSGFGYRACMIALGILYGGKELDRAGDVLQATIGTDPVLFDRVAIRLRYLALQCAPKDDENAN